MRILVMSDTHGSLKALLDIQEQFDLGQFDAIFHLGDVLYHGPRNPLPEGYDPKGFVEVLKNYRIKYIRGNCDADVDLKVLGLAEMPRISIDYFGDFSFLLIHGEQFEENSLEQFLNAKDVHFLLHGHTHIPKIEEFSGKVVINPGSTSLPKGGTPRSVLTFQIDGQHISASFYDLTLRQIYMEAKWILKDTKLLRER
ncbi:MAG TPA: phosphodiesterase [Fervidobacterium sp.]|nr:phosphodiesterase [Fervidobacterium sp.]HOP83040.1 phosphodiesterase [Fervidobacterium sp.]HPT59688.1 phosphodiesterase [Fervidobacterium sp.]